MAERKKLSAADLDRALRGLGAQFRNYSPRGSIAASENADGRNPTKRYRYAVLHLSCVSCTNADFRYQSVICYSRLGTLLHYPGRCPVAT